MSVIAHQDVIGDFSQLKAALSEGPDSWLPAPFDYGTARIAELHAETPFGELSRVARIEIGRPELREDEVVVPINWQSLDGSGLFPIFYGELRLERVALGRSQLKLHGYYVPPDGTAGRPADAALFNAVAKASVENFVGRVAGILARSALGPSADDKKSGSPV